MDHHAQGTGAYTSPSTLLVGLKLTPESRELLTWVVASLTKPRDQVIGIHVLPSSTHAEYSGEELDPTIKQQLDNTFEAVLGVYQGLCTLKQLQLDIKVIAGMNLKEGLVETAKVEKATKLILGSNGRQTIRQTHAFAKYCVQRLPLSCSVLVIEHGEIIFNKPGTLESQGNSKQSAGEVLRRSMRRFKGGSHKKSPLAIADNSSHKNQDSSICVSTSVGSNNLRLYNIQGAKSSATDKYHPDSPVSVLCCNPDEKFHQTSCLDQKSALFDQKTSNTDSQIADQRNAEIVEYGITNSDHSTQPGWPLMHRAICPEKVITSDADARHLSVVKWALQLPNRPILPLHSLLNSEDQNSPSQDCMHHHDGHKTLLCGHSSRDAADWGGITDCSKQGEIDAFQTRISGDVGEVAIRNTFSEDREKEGHEADQLDRRNLQLAQKLDILCINRACSSYSYEELEKATSHFSSRNLIGQGGCSQVYQGALQDGQRIAVKCLTEGSIDAENELLTEVEILSTLRHRNIISLLGFCVDSRRRLLVYNLAQQGNLDENLHGGQERPVLEWAARHRIAMGAARALEYLHAGCPCPVVHRDIKSSNILLTSDFQPQISDFGLAKWAPLSSSYATCNDVVGTFGYLAPEYFMFGKVNEKTDVYSFGVVLLELITGKQPIDISKPKGQENLVVWARTLLEGGHFEQLVDPKLKNYDVEQMKNMIVVAAICIRQSPRSRPRISQVLKVLSVEEDYGISLMKHHLHTTKIKEDECFSKEYLDGNGYCAVRPHLALAFFGADDDDEAASECSTDRSYNDLITINPSKNLEEYFVNRYSRSSSFE